MSRLVVVCLVIALSGLGVATAASLLGAWSPVADAFSHFRMHIAAACLLLAVLALALNWRLAVAGVVLSALNVGLALAYVPAPRVAAAGGTVLKVMTLNVLYSARNDDQIVAQIAVEQPDVILFQELTSRRQPLLRRLQASHPWQISCGDISTASSWPCDVAIVSRHRWEAAEARPAGATFTKLAWARFGPEWGNTLVASVHLKWPLVSDQAAQLAAVRDVVARHSGPVIVAGDLNASPWSAAVRSFTRSSRLQSAAGFIPTWPRRTYVSGRPCALCIPQLQIDHVFVSAQVRVLGMRAGGDVGSDHLPLIADLEVPRGLAAAR